MSQRVFTYFAAVPDIHVMEQLRLISLWCDNWRDAGFDPYVISGEQTAKLPGYDEYLKGASRYFSSNPAGYDLNCYLRWFAVGSIGDKFSIMADYDCFNYSWKSPASDIEQDIPGLEPVLPPLTIWQGHVPCLVSGPKEAFVKMAMAFLKQPAVAGVHTSDMLMLASGTMGVPVKKSHMVKSYGEEGWDTAPVVHYPNSSMTPAGKQPKFAHIANLRKWNGQ